MKLLAHTFGRRSEKDPKGLQVVVNGWHHIGGYDFNTGKELWMLKGGGDIPVPTPVFQDGTIVITNARRPQKVPHRTTTPPLFSV